MLDSLCTTSSSPLWSTSWPGTYHFILHTFLHPIIVFLTTYAHIAICFAVVPRLCHLFLVSLSTVYLKLYLCHTSIWPFSSLPFYSSMDSVRETRTTRVSRYQKKHSPTHTSWSSVIPYLLLPSLTIHNIFLFNLCAWQCFSRICLQVFFGLPLGLAPPTSYSIQSLSSFRSICPYHRNVFCCSTEIMSSNPSLSLNPLLRKLNATHPSNHSHLCPLKCHLVFLS